MEPGDTHGSLGQTRDCREDRRKKKSNEYRPPGPRSPGKDNEESGLGHRERGIKGKKECSGEQRLSYWHSRTIIRLGTMEATALFLELNEIKHIMKEAKCQAHKKEERYFPSPKWGVCVCFVSIQCG